MPSVSETKGSKIDASKIKIIFIISNSNLIKIIKSPIKMHGSIINKADKTFAFTMLKGFIGKLLSIVKVFPSKDIIELVIDVIKLLKQIIPNFQDSSYFYLNFSLKL